MPHREGLANPLGSESCVDVGTGGDEALTGGCAGGVWSLEIGRLLGADVVRTHGRQHGGARTGEGSTALAGSETPRMPRRTRHGNRESPGRPAASTAGRKGKSKDTRRRWTDPGSRMGVEYQRSLRTIRSRAEKSGSEWNGASWRLIDCGTRVYTVDKRAPFVFHSRCTLVPHVQGVMLNHALFT